METQTKSRWSEKDVRKFEKARRYLEEITPQIQSKVEGFNDTNEVGWKASFEIGERTDRPGYRWGILHGHIPYKEGSRRKQVLIGSDFIVHVASDEELRVFSGFAAEVAEEHDLRARRILESGEQPTRVLVDYSLTPHFEKFQQ